MRKIISLAIAALTLLPTTLSAQEKESKKDYSFKANVQADVVSRYMWRGTDKGGISIQPQAGITWQGLYLDLQGNSGFDKADEQELDVSLGFKRWGINIGVTDYWQTGIEPDNRYFYFDEQKTAHQLEGNVGFSCKYFSLQGYTIFWGNDYKINGDRAYSTYVELSIPFRTGGLDWDVRAGITPMESAGKQVPNQVVSLLGTTTTIYTKDYFYGDAFTCTRASVRATKNMTFEGIRFPVFAELHANPYLQRANFLVGFSIIPFD